MSSSAARAEPEIVRATFAHALALAPQMRGADVRELLDGVGERPLVALVGSLAASDEAYAWFVGAELGALFGVAGAGRPREGIVWLLTTAVVERWPRLFVQNARVVVADLLERWDLLWNMVGEGNPRALRWAAWAGFSVGQACPFGHLGLPFRRIEIRAGGRRCAR